MVTVVVRTMIIVDGCHNDVGGDDCNGGFDGGGAVKREDPMTKF